MPEINIVLDFLNTMIAQLTQQLEKSTKTASEHSLVLFTLLAHFHDISVAILTCVSQHPSHCTTQNNPDTQEATVSQRNKNRL